MKIITQQQQTIALEKILHQLQLSASRISDEDFKKYGCQGLTHAIQDVKALIQISRDNESLEYFDTADNSMGLHNMM